MFAVILFLTLHPWVESAAQNLIIEGTTMRPNFARKESPDPPVPGGYFQITVLSVVDVKIMRALENPTLNKMTKTGTDTANTSCSVFLRSIVRWVSESHDLSRLS